MDQLSDFASVVKAADQVELAEIEVDEQIRALCAKRSEIDGRLAELRCSLPDFNAIHDNSRNLSRMVGQASELALELSGKIRQLDLVKNRVLECVSKLDGIINLKMCASKAEMALNEKRFEDAAGHVNSFLKTKKDIIELAEKITSDKQAHDAVTVLKKCREKLVVIAEQQFDQAVKVRDKNAVEQFCKIFPLINEHDAGLKRFGDYLCLAVRQKCNGLISISEMSGEKEQGTTCVNLLTEIFEFIAETVRDNQPYVETFFGPGRLFGIATLIQTECDTLVRRVIDRFRSQYRLSELFRLIQPSTSFGTRTSQLGLPISTSVSSSNSTSTMTTLDTLGGGSSGQVQLERILALEPILSEIVLLNTRTDLYMRFMRRHITSDLNNAALPTQELDEKLKNVKNLFNQCQTVRLMQDLISGYIHLEGYYLREMVSKAVHSDEVDENGKALRFADDVFFVLKNCLGRALTSGNVDGICAMLNHARMILLDELVTNVLTARVRAGFPSGWMQDAYSYMQSSVAAVSVNPMVAGVSGASSSSTCASASVAASSGHAARMQYLVTLNTIKACQKNLVTLHAHLERNLAAFQDSTQDKTNLNKLSACMDELKQSVADEFQRLLDKGFAQLTSAVIRTQAKTVLQPFTSQSYELTEDDLDLYGANDPWMENCVAELDQFLKPFRVVLSQDNNDHLVCVLTTELVRHMEQLIQRKTYNRFGAIQLEKELRCLFAYLTSITYVALRDHFTCLLQTCSLLNLDKVSEVAFYWNSATWRLTPNEVRRILSLRVEFTTDEIRRLKL